MGLWDIAKKVGKTAFDVTPLGVGYNLATSEDFRSKIPGLNELTGAQSDAEKQLLAKQEELAKEARQRQQQQQQARMNALGQSLLAFNPQNQMMAQMFGPGAAFTPEQFAQMAQNPMPNETPWGTGTDQQRAEQVQRRDAERARQERIRGQMQPLPQGPAPINMPRPAPARRY
jgi:hypothetical protein